MRLTAAFIKSVFDAKLAFYDIGQRFKTLTDQLSGLLVDDTQSVSTYLGLRKRLLLRDGRVYNYVADSTLPVDNGMVLPVAGKNPVLVPGRWIGDAADGVNIKRWYEAQGNGNANDTVAINRAIAFVKRQIGLGYGVYRPTVIFPSGFYRTEGVNATELNGICLQGEGGSYVNATLIGIGNNAIVDVTGSSQFKIFNLGFISNKLEVGCAKIGILCSLGQIIAENGDLITTGGLNGTVKGCSFELDDLPQANGGFGSVGIANVCSEEMAITDCLIRANCPVLLTQRFDLTALTGKPCIFKSDYGTVHPNGPSMTVVRIDDNVSLQVIQRRTPGLVLVNAGSVFFNGYITQYKRDEGTEKVAIRAYGQAQNMTFDGVVEGFSTIFDAPTIVNDVYFRMETANQQDKTQPIFITARTLRIKDCRWTVTFPNVDDLNGRFFLYHPPINGNNSPASIAIINSTFACSDWIDNGLFISANALKQATNCHFLTGQPFARINTSVVDLKGYVVPLGTVPANNSDVVATVVRFRKPEKGDPTVGNGGVYRGRIRGLIVGGTYSSAGRCHLDVDASFLLAQNANGTLHVPSASSQVLVLNENTTNEAFLKLSVLNFGVDMSGNFGVFQLVIRNSGTGVNQPITFQGKIELIGDFAVEAPILFA